MENPNNTEKQSNDTRNPSSSTENLDRGKETTDYDTANTSSTRASTIIITEDISNTETLICLSSTAEWQNNFNVINENKVIFILAVVSAILLTVCIILTILVMWLSCSKRKYGRWSTRAHSSPCLTIEYTLNRILLSLFLFDMQ